MYRCLSLLLALILALSMFPAFAAGAVASTPLDDADAPRGANVLLAARAVNQFTLASGETFSFNDVVGERTAAKGYQTGTVYVGGISAPYLSSFGVHIVKYLHDIPGGPVEMTQAQREAKRAEILNEKQNELYSAKIDEWLEQAQVQYTGAITTLEALQAAEDAAAE